MALGSSFGEGQERFSLDIAEGSLGELTALQQQVMKSGVPISQLRQKLGLAPLNEAGKLSTVQFNSVTDLRNALGVQADANTNARAKELQIAVDTNEAKANAKANNTNVNPVATPGGVFFGTQTEDPVAAVPQVTPQAAPTQTKPEPASGTTALDRFRNKATQRRSTQQNFPVQSGGGGGLTDQISGISQSLDVLKRAKEAGLQITPQTSVQDAQRFLGEGENQFIDAQGNVPQKNSAAEISYQNYEQKFGLTQSQESFTADPLKSIGEITSQILGQMGFGEANAEYTKISDELEKLSNKRDEELRRINDDPWVTEGVRLRLLQKANEKWDDQINNRVNKLQLLESIRKDAQQNAQFALGTAINLFDSERRFQQDQVQMYYQQAQQQFENQLKLQAANAPEKGTSDMQEYIFAVENGQFNGSFIDWKGANAAAVRAPVRLSGGGGVSPVVGDGVITDASGKPIKLSAAQTNSIAGFNATIDSANSVLRLLDQGTKTGPIAGRKLQFAKLLGNANQQQLQVEQILGKLKAEFMKAISGAAVSDQEVIRLSKFLPDITDQETVIKSKLETLKRETNNQKSNLLRTLGGTEGSSSGGNTGTTTGTTSSGLGYTIIP